MCKWGVRLRCQGAAFRIAYRCVGVRDKVQSATEPADGLPMRLRHTPIRFMLLVLGVFLALAASPALGSSQPLVTAPDQEVAPNPARQSMFDSSQMSGAELGSIRIPSIGLDEVIRSGVDMNVIDQGVAHWSGTSLAGDPGNVVLAGHRTTHSRPFWALGDLAVGDLIYLEDGSGFDVIYRVAESFIVEPSALWITYETDEPTLTMFACHPKGSARFRIVVSADLLAGRQIA